MCDLLLVNGQFHTQDPALPRVTAAAMDRLAAFAWPGNVRQLQNEVRRALLLSDGIIDEEHLSPEIAGEGGADGAEVGDGYRPFQMPECPQMHGSL